MSHLTPLARIPLDDGSDLVVSLDADGAVDLREWTITGYTSMPTGKGGAIPKHAISQMIDALKSAIPRQPEHRVAAEHTRPRRRSVPASSRSRGWSG
jgi:hypothetical protein